LLGQCRRPKANKMLATITGRVAACSKLEDRTQRTDECWSTALHNVLRVVIGNLCHALRRHSSDGCGGATPCRDSNTSVKSLNNSNDSTRRRTHSERISLRRRRPSLNGASCVAEPRV